MKKPHSLQSRLGISLGALLVAIWLGAATLTAALADKAINEVFDSALQETAQRILPLAVSDILGRETQGETQKLAEVRAHDELLTYIVRDGQDSVLLRSHDADLAAFPRWDGAGFRQTTTHRIYNEEALQGTIRITIAEPLSHRTVSARKILWGLGISLALFLPVALLAIVLTVRASLAPLRRYRDRLAARSERDLSLIPLDELPAEVSPVADALNELLGKLAAAFEAERSFSANAAHELRTPIAGAIAQVQRLHAESHEPETRRRAADIDATLKRLTRLSERLMQLARAEGGQLRLDRTTDLRPVARLLADDLSRAAGMKKISLSLPDTALVSDLDPDVFGIVFRNLIENALRHGAEGSRVDVALDHDGLLTVSNDGPAIPETLIKHLTNRFERGETSAGGTGLGLAIVNAVAQRIGGELRLQSPRTGQSRGFEASFRIPLTESASATNRQQS